MFDISLKLSALHENKSDDNTCRRDERFDIRFIGMMYVSRTPKASQWQRMKKRCTFEFPPEVGYQLIDDLCCEYLMSWSTLRFRSAYLLLLKNFDTADFSSRSIVCWIVHNTLVNVCIGRPASQNNTVASSTRHLIRPFAAKGLFPPVYLLSTTAM